MLVNPKYSLEIHVTGNPGLYQPLLNTYDIALNFDLSIDNTYEKIWKFPTFVGMKVGRSTITGTISWKDEEGDQEIQLNGIGTVWNMRR